MIAQEAKQQFQIVHDECPILIKIGDQLVDVREIRRVAHDGKTCFVLIPVEYSVVTK